MLRRITLGGVGLIVSMVIRWAFPNGTERFDDLILDVCERTAEHMGYKKVNKVFVLLFVFFFVFVIVFRRLIFIAFIYVVV